ncbi:MAG TPA: radical SAM protein, partial [Chromatiales bacterium]|nr:radical SAM protein [Chromatiales bacterium]
MRRTQRYSRNRSGGDSAVPCTIGVQLTTRCDLHCAHCYVDAPQQDLHVDMFARIARQARDVGCTCMEFTGGEPTCHQLLPEILRALREHSLACTFVSNGWNFARVFPVLAGFEEQVRHISFSLESTTAGFHDRCRGHGSFDRVMHAAERCAQTDMAFG